MLLLGNSDLVIGSCGQSERIKNHFKPACLLNIKIFRRMFHLGPTQTNWIPLTF